MTFYLQNVEYILLIFFWSCWREPNLLSGLVLTYYSIFMANLFNENDSDFAHPTTNQNMMKQGCKSHFRFLGLRLYPIYYARTVSNQLSLFALILYFTQIH